MATASRGRSRRMPEEEHENHERWLVTYADMITLLMVLFIVMFAISQVDQKKFNELKDGLAAGFGTSESVLEDSSSVLDANGQQPISPQLGAETNGQKSAGTSDAQGSANAGQAQQVADEEAARRAAAAEMSQLLATQAELERKLEAAGLLEDVKFTLDERGLVLSLVSRHIVFAPDLATLTPRGEQILAALGPVLADLHHDLEIAGHTNQEPVKPRYFASDWDLSAARAITVLKYLTHRSDIPTGRVHATAYGHTRPLVPVSNPEAKLLNRRVDVIVLREHGGELPPASTPDALPDPSAESNQDGSNDTETNASHSSTSEGGDS